MKFAYAILGFVLLREISSFGLRLASFASVGIQLRVM